MVEATDEGDQRTFRTAWWQRIVSDPSTYELTRFLILRWLGFVYLVAFLVLWRQGEPLLGAHGLLPAQEFLARVRSSLGPSAYWRVPTIFWTLPGGASDAAMRVACGLGLVLSAATMAGVTNAGVQLVLWALYLSFVHVGQIFYGYGWETQLLETGFLAVFLCPLRGLSPWPSLPASKIVIWLLRWLIFRVMVGSALIKLRGAPCWRDLTCLDVFYETQPNPNPLSYLLHHAPHAVHVSGVLVNHFVELVVPWFCFGLRWQRLAAGALLVGFQCLLIASGNLSFLNWLTIVPALACFDDRALARLVPPRWREALRARAEGLRASMRALWTGRALAFTVAVLSVGPVLNLASCRQTMNTSFEPLDLVNTYGAFGAVDRERYEVILEGTSDPVPDRRAHWEEYELPCMPGDPWRRPCVVTPYHYRLDWQMWFVGNASAEGEAISEEPWLVHLVWQLLSGEGGPKVLLARDPFPGAPPRWIRADIWKYEFASGGSPREPSDPRNEAGARSTRSPTDTGVFGPGAPDDGGAERSPPIGRHMPWWVRRRVGIFLRPVSLEDEVLRRYVEAFGWSDAP